MKLLQKFISIAATAAFCVSPPAVQAHGEISIRIQSLTRILATNATAQLHLDRAELHRAHLDWPAAQVDLDQASKLEPSNPSVTLARARLWRDSGRVEEARKAFDQAVADAPNNGEAWFERGEMLVQIGEIDAGSKDLVRGFELLIDPTPAQALLLARVLHETDRTQEAINILDRSLGQVADDTSLQKFAIELELARRNPSAALHRIDEALAKASRKEPWFFRQAQVLARSGRNEEARVALQNSLEAIALLPAVLQRSKPMLDLKTRIEHERAALP